MVLCKHYFACLLSVKIRLQLIGNLFIEITFLSRINVFSETWISVDVQRAKEKFSDNTGHNILELYNVLVKVGFATSKMKLDI